MSTQVPRGSAGFRVKPMGQRAHPLGSAMLPWGHARTELRVCLSWEEIWAGAHCLLGKLDAGTASPPAEVLHPHLTGFGLFLLPPALGSAWPSWGDQERCQQLWGSELPRGLGSCRVGERQGWWQRPGGLCLAILPGSQRHDAPRVGCAPGVLALFSPLLRWLLSFAAAND